jgi:hypothetical protein
LNALFAREQGGQKLILPIWHGITRDDLLQYSPAFADRLAKISSSDSYADIVASLLALLGHTERAKTSGQAAVDNGTRKLTERKQKPNAIAHARYETKGENTLRADAYVRPSTNKDGWYMFENSFGEEEHGTREDIAMRFTTFDKGLIMKGYIRMNYANLSGDRAFDL